MRLRLPVHLQFYHNSIIFYNEQRKVIAGSFPAETTKYASVQLEHENKALVI